MSNTSKKPHLDEETRRRVDQLKNNLPQSLLIIGAAGAGAFEVARFIAGSNLTSIIEPTDNKDALDTEKGIIRVKQIRSLILQSSSRSSQRRVCIINHADKMNIQAQNAFLKILEEPASSSHFILVAASQTTLLPTILSRVQKMTLPRLRDEEVLRLLKKRGISDPRTIAQITYLAMGQTQSIERLATDPGLVELHGQRLKDAQTLLGGNPLDQLTVINTYSTDRSKALELIASARTIMSHTLDAKPSAEIAIALSRLADTDRAIRANGNARLQLMAFVL